jgi:hypothetical protein
MLLKRVMDLPNWGSGPAAAFKPGETLAVSLENVIIERVIPGQKSYLGIAGRFNQRTVFYNIGPLDEKTLEKVAKIVDENRGQPLLSIGTIQIPPDED